MPYRKLKSVLNVLAVVLLIIVALALFAGVGYIVYDVLTNDTSRGIVIVTALLSGGLIATDEDGTESVIWDPIPIDEFPIQEILSTDGSLDVNLALESVTKAFNASGQNMFSTLFNLFDNLEVVAETGESVLNVRPANMSDSTHAKYGVLNVYKETFDMFEERYGDKAEVSVFNYDWRLDNERNAELLEKYINEKGYDEVVLTSHSMGGNVVAGYLARSAENREKVKLYCAYAPSLLGSVDALAYLEDPSLVLDMLGALNLGALQSVVEQLVNKIAGPLLRSMPSIAQLLPSPYLMTSAQYSEDSPMITVDGKAIETPEELIEFYCSRSWTSTESGEKAYMFQTEDNGKTRLENFFDSVYVETENGKVHSTELVNTVYFVGTGVSGKERAEFVTDPVSGEIVLSKTYTSTRGDNMVLEYSATAGKGISGDNVEAYLGYGHHVVGIKFKDVLMERTFAETDKVFG